MLLNDQWLYHRGSVKGAEVSSYDDSRWKKVCLPHCESLLQEERPYQGDCWYRKRLFFEPGTEDALHVLLFEGAMHTTDVWLNGQHSLTHLGGYLPFHVEIPSDAHDSGEVQLALRVNNEDNPDLPPGRPMRMLDRVYYGGLYRNVHQLTLDRLHITRPEICHLPGAGVFVGTRSCDETSAELDVRCGIQSRFDISHECWLQFTLLDPSGETVVSVQSTPMSIETDELRVIHQTLFINQPRLWSCESPSLYTLRLSLRDGRGEADQYDVPVGIRRVELSAERTFRLNGNPVYLHGVTRHPDSPGIGSALSDAAHARDARRIKQAGFNVVRCGDLPQSTAFLAACDQLGLLVINSLTGWEHGQQTAAHEQHLYDNCRALVQRDRNHPAIIAWDVSVYEGGMFEEMMTTMHTIAHEEFPGDQMISIGRSDSSSHDVYGLDCRLPVKNPSSKLTTLLLNYGGELDDPGGLPGVLERASAVHGIPHIGVIMTCMFSHLRGDRGGLNSGVMEDYRRPGESYDVVRALNPAAGPCAPFVRIQGDWLPGSESVLVVLSNCSVVSLFLNGQLVETGKASGDSRFSGLPHPPFMFSLPTYETGVLKAVGYIQDKEAAVHQLVTPGQASVISLRVDDQGIPLQADGADAVFVHAAALDQSGKVVPDELIEIRFQVEGAGIPLTPLAPDTRRGQASILIQSRQKAGEIKVTAYSPGLTEGLCRFASS
jgi:beta-galactosidase